MTSKSARAFTNYVWFTIVYVVGVIMWGAYVRATGSGAGCGEHWPMCNGEIIPRAPSTKMLIEFSHRLTSGLSLIFVLVSLIWARRIFPKGHPARKGALFSFGFILGEAGVGAMLVLLALVANNDSSLRAVVIALHLINTFLLLYWLVYTAHGGTRAAIFALAKVGWPRERTQLFSCLALFALVGAAGAIVALGDTLFPAASLAEGLKADMASDTHFLIRLRFLHPLLAVIASLYIMLQMSMLPRVYRGKFDSGRCFWVTGLLCVQLVSGIINVALLAPVWMQLVHLALADLTWIVLASVYVKFLQTAEFETRAEPPVIAIGTSSV